MSDRAVPDDPHRAGTADDLTAICFTCGRPLERVLAQLGSLRCHDCRDAPNTQLDARHLPDTGGS